MQKIQSNKLIMHNLEIIQNKISDLKKHKEIINNSKIEKNILNIEKELEKIAYYYNLDLIGEEVDFAMKKKITIKNKKPSKSFSRWLFNNKEL